MLLGIIQALQEKRDEAISDAHHDALTGVYNRKAFVIAVEHEMARVRRYNVGASVIYFDLNGFKPVNDSCGHLEGDRALQQIAKAVNDNKRESDIFARLGGDEFAILCVETRPHQTRTFLDRLKETVFPQHFISNNQVYSIGASFGLAHYNKSQKDSYLSAEKLIGRADKAMYRAKHAYKATFAL